MRKYWSLLVCLALFVGCTDDGGTKAIPVSSQPSGSSSSTTGAGSTGGGATGGGTTTPQAPAATATVQTPSGSLSGTVSITWDLSLASGQTTDVTVEVTSDERVWFDATAGTGGSGTRNLSSGTHTFAWNSTADLGPTEQTHVRVRITPTGGQPAETNTFTVDNRRVQVNTRLTRYPYLMNGSQNQMTVLWKTGAKTNGAVRYGTTTSLNQVETSPKDDFHEVTLTGLTPGTTYYYRVIGDGQILSPIHRFKTHPARTGSDFSFWAFGDCGHPSTEQDKLAEVMRKEEGDFAIIMGDVVYDIGAWWEFDPNFFEPYRDLFRDTPFYPALGNHDIITFLGQPYLQNFALPTNNPKGSERYYSFEYGNALFICLDSSTSVIVPGTGQHRFLLDELMRPDRPEWTFVYMHHPPYSSGVHGSDKPLRWVVSPLFEDNDVDVVFTGHDHHYERTKVIKDYNQSGRGVVYVVAGSAAKLRRDGSSSFTASHASEYAVLQVDIKGKTLSAQALKTDGSVLDAWTITK